jgi:hypothetical protein
MKAKQLMRLYVIFGEGPLDGLSLFIGEVCEEVAWAIDKKRVWGD